MRIFCEHKIVLFDFTSKPVLITQLLPAQWTQSPLCYLTKQYHDRRGTVGSWKCSEAVKAPVGRAAPPAPGWKGRPAAHRRRGQWWCCCWCPPRCWPCRCNPPRPAAEPAPGAGCRRCARSRRDWEPAANGEMEPFTGKYS